jgi:biotin-(acetyl-CoA carboxylase) ligase
MTEKQPDFLASFVEEWRKYDVMLGKQVNLFIGQNCYPGEVAGISDEGLLLLKTLTGETKAFASGEVSFKKS